MRKEQEARSHGGAKGWYELPTGTGLEEQGERALDCLMGEALLANVRLAKVLEVRRRLLEGNQREVVLAFAREVKGK